MNSLIIAANIIRRAFKNRKELILMIVLPIAAIGLINFINGNPQLQKADIGIVNLDNGVYSGNVISHIQRLNYVKIVNIDTESYRDAVKKGTANFVLVIPKDFSDTIESGNKTNIELYCGSMKSTSEKLKSDINLYATELYMMSSSAADISSNRKMNRKEVFDAISKNVGSNRLSVTSHLSGKSTNEEMVRKLLASIGFSIMFLMVFIFNTIGTIIEDRKRRTMARMFTYPVRERDIVAGNLIGSLFLGTIQLVPVVAVLAVIYNIKSLIIIAGIFVILFSFMISTIGLGIGISGFIKSEYNPSLIVASVIFPTCLIGGCLVPQSLLPSFMAPISYAVPQKWVLTAISQLMTGAGFQDIILSIGIILMFGFAFATFGVKLLRPISD